MKAHPKIDQPWNDFYTELRESSNAVSWSKSVQIARGRNIEWQYQSDEKKFDARVLANGENIAKGVSLFVEDQDWVCDGECADDPCTHILATAICVQQDLKAGLSERRAERSGRAVPLGKVQYSFSSRPEGLWFERMAVAEGMSIKMSIPLDSFVATKSRDLVMVLSKNDYLLDRAIRDDRRGILRVETMKQLIEILSKDDRSDVTLDGKKIGVDPEFIGFDVTLRDQDSGVQILGEPDSRISKFYKNGAAVAGGSLHPAGIPKLGADVMQLLQQKKIFAPHELDRLESEILPVFEGKVRLRIESKRLRHIVAVAPRIEMQTTPRKTGVEVRAVIVYGEPAVAVVEGEQLRVLGNVTPIRNRDRERFIRDQYWQRCQKEIGSSYLLEPEGVESFLHSLSGWKKLDAEIDKSQLKDFRISDELDFSFEQREGAVGIAVHSKKSGSLLGKNVMALAMQAHRNGERLIPMPEGGWAKLPAQWFEQNGALADELCLANDEKGRIGELHLAAISSEIADRAGLNFDLLSAIQLKDKYSFKVDEALNSQLRAYQKTGAEWLAERLSAGLGAVLADDMGLGKTIQTLSIVKAKTLVILPTSLIANWQKELATFRPELSVHVFYGVDRSLNDEADVILTTYAVARIDEGVLSEKNWDLLIIDEAHYIKNPSSLTSTAIRRLNADAKVALTGTPIENHLTDLWSLFDFCVPGYLSSVAHFKKRYSSADAKSLAALEKKVSPFILRRTKEVVAPELPEKTEITHHVILEEQEQAIYQGLLSAAHAEMQSFKESGTGLSAANPIFQHILKLRQACCHQSLLKTPNEGLSSKTTMLIELLTELVDEGHKVLVFSQWTSFLDLIEPKIGGLSVNYERLDGQTKDRSGVVDRFQQDEDVKILLLSLKAGGVGLNLTAADHVIFLDPWWNPMVERQAHDRVHRIGQTKPVFVHRLIAENSIEERIVALAQRKAALADDLLEGRDSSLSLDDIGSLLFEQGL